MAGRITKALDDIHAGLEREAGWIVFASMVLFFILAFSSRLGPPGFARWPICIGATILLLSSILLFTRPLKSATDINAIFRYGWAFLAAAMIFGVVTLYSTVRPPDERQAPVAATAAKPSTTAPASAPAAAAPTVASKAAITAAGSAETPEKPPASGYQPFRRDLYVIALVRGCDFDGERSTRAGLDRAKAEAATASGNAPERRPPNPGMPEGLHCGDLAPQWVISIGGSIMKCHYDGICPKGTRPSGEDAPTLQKKLTAIETQIAAETGRSAEARRRLAGLRELAEAGMGGDQSSQAGFTGTQAQASQRIAELNKEAADLRTRLATASGWENFAWNIDGGPIVGGIVVPVYFVVLAWIGALISMMRKLPEFQNRVEPEYRKEYEEKNAAGETALPPISYGYARDLVVFQLLQVLSAPAIAIVAYAWARPEEVMTTVLLAFAAGFSSEVFLLAIRGVVDRLIGLGPRPLRVRNSLDAAGGTPAPVPTPRPGPQPATPPVSEKFKVNDRVELTQPVSAFMPGARGVVVSITAAHTFVVRITHDHTGMPINFLLDARSADSFRLQGDDVEAQPQPVG